MSVTEKGKGREAKGGREGFVRRTQISADFVATCEAAVISA